MLRHRKVFTVCLLVLITLSPQAAPGATSLTERWWNWQGQYGSVNSPVLDRTGAFCALGQAKSGDWLVAGSFGTRETRKCRIPAGRKLAGPLLNMINGEMTPAAQAFVTLDGVKQKVFEERTTFRLVTVRDNPVCDNCKERVSAQGFWFRTAPLKKGQHKLVINGVANDGFETVVTYEIEAV